MTFAPDGGVAAEVRTEDGGAPQRCGVRGAGAICSGTVLQLGGGEERAARPGFPGRAPSASGPAVSRR
ncbi:hypothetical protein ACIQWA_00435 [Kitasatospora sp. NPDC098652]|uniref:hypothetical protein n=1 Tax=Kitasatospora sp. NPDC098652 TaxID=3364095 RepID=UPI0037F9132D